MVHKALIQTAADAAAMERGAYALHIGKIGDNMFVYSVRPGNSADFNPLDPTVITVDATVPSTLNVRFYSGDEALRILDETNLREFSTGRAIFKKYCTLVKNISAIIGEPPGYAESVVNAVESKAIKASTLYQYLELAEHYHKKLRIVGDDIELI